MLQQMLKTLTGHGDDELAHRLERAAHGLNAFGYDKWGFSPQEALSYLRKTAWLYRNYWRVETHGIDHVPAGRGMLIGNHSSQMAYDGVMIATAMLLEAEPPRVTRAMIEKFFNYQPFLNVLMTRSGQLTGLPENCQRLLEEDELILVFPEGARGGGKTYWDRYQLQQFGQGFLRLALKTQAPIIPFGFIGGEEVCPSLVNIKPLARMLGMPYCPVTPTILPLPLPAKCAIYFGEPLRFEGTGNEEDGDINDKIDLVKRSIAELIDRGLQERRSVFW